MSQKSFEQTEKRLPRYPMDWYAKCQKCPGFFHTKLKMEHNQNRDTIYFYRPRFCSEHRQKNEILIIKKMDENGTEYPARTHTDDITELTTK